ncbi:hypothetical protein RUM43_001671 [Polyplax serrata]|uniref:BZIP domain-containing protein n=1 Tax=Polyplax serrata TaxID=468196 RepID=A0AAN8SFT2_POLSC
MSNQKLPKMYNLNVNVATTLPVNFLGIDGQSNTPRTPEIVNSLVAMTNPFDALMKPTKGSNSPGSEESYSETVSPLGSPASSPPSVQHTRSQLIKEGLKLTIQTKRKHSGSDTKDDVEEFEAKRMRREELTEEDEERRKRRRERNKIAATKCRMKKREKTANLVNESELLETQNIELKTQIQDLQKQKKKLIDMLSMHSATCVKQSSPTVQNFEEFVGPNESFGNRFEGHPFCEAENNEDFQVGSTNGTTAMNPYGKDPNFAKLMDDVSTTTNYSRSFERPFVPTNVGYRDTDTGLPPTTPTAATAATATNYYQNKNRNVECNNKLSVNRSCYEYQSEKKSDKSKGIALKGRSEMKTLSGTYDEDENQVYRNSFHCGLADADGGDTYKPNGIIDGNFFANRTDVFGTGNDYANAFGNNPLDNGCMA